MNAVRDALVRMTGVDPVGLALIAFAMFAAAIALILVDVCRAASARRARREREAFMADLNRALWDKAAATGDPRPANVIRFPEHGKGY